MSLPVDVDCCLNENFEDLKKDKCLWCGISIRL